MVHTWNADPSPDQSRSPPLVPEKIQVHGFKHVPRFTRETGKIHNFLNGRDPEGRELSPKRLDKDTNTHTVFDDRLCEHRSVLAIQDEISQSIKRNAGMRSRRPKSATSRTLISNDTRFELLKDSYAVPLGPGDYHIEEGSPGVGPLSHTSPTRGLSPSRDPWRFSASFISPGRRPLFQPTEGADVMYHHNRFRADYNNSVAWHIGQRKGSDIPDYRYALRYKESRKDIPRDRDYDGAAGMDTRARPTTVQATANGPKRNSVAFNSREPRLAHLPNLRSSDTRLKQRSDEDPAALGPGSYGPLTSIGGAKRKTYRLSSSQDWTAALQWPGGKGPAGVHGGAGAVVAGLSGSKSFVTTYRGQKYGPHTWATDSTLTRTM